jgi:5-methylcytosine-specific restriction enzyme A
MSDYFGFDGIDEAWIKREKSKARALRKTRWWQKKTAMGQCWYCRKAVIPGELTMDHLIPLAMGGESSKDNLVPSCKDCNNKKKSMMPMEWEEYRKRIQKEEQGRG